MTITTTSTKPLSLVEEARQAIRAIRPDGRKDQVSEALAALMKCSRTYGWNEFACQNLIYKAWGKHDQAGATVRRRRKHIQDGLVLLVRQVYALEASVNAVLFEPQAGTTSSERPPMQAVN